MKPYTKECECCGHKITAYTHKLNHRYIDALEKLVEYRNKHSESAKSSDLGLSNAQYSSFHRLKFRGLIEGSEGYRKPTRLGISFIDGKVPVFEMIANMGKQLLPIDHEFRILKGKTPQKKYIYELDNNYSHKKTKEYQFEKGLSSQRLFS